MSISKYAQKQRKGFTLIELLVVIAVIALLMGMLLPALNLVKKRAKRVICQNNLHQCVAAMFMYAGDFDDALPTGSIIDRTAPGYATSWDRADQMGAGQCRDHEAPGRRLRPDR